MLNLGFREAGNKVGPGHKVGPGNKVEPGNNAGSPNNIYKYIYIYIYIFIHIYIYIYIACCHFALRSDAVRRNTGCKDEGLLVAELMQVSLPVSAVPLYVQRQRHAGKDQLADRQNSQQAMPS